MTFKRTMWTLGIIAFLVLGVFVYLVVSDIMTKEEVASESNQTEEAESGKVSTEKIEETQATVGEDNKDVGKFVSKTHDFYNDTTGYGAINSLDWKKQREKARTILSEVKSLKANVTSESLIVDLEEIESYASAALEEKDKETIRNLHRMFHDLDIALNSYSGTDKVWGITETLESAQ
ncbi:hypothetical protein [Halobacillus naozhouensis]|uniref:Uncharacterized protein n=1 Tax=Halobacillus naozhouensis TaxID=554880 RepID=A0ABY8J0C1_9BACI|nr:hypothetical protein [Halobacillus naozhouensis]WFT75947.1 hypothetical protein P9989_06155 [Halobacillus naozhouensis]